MSAAELTAESLDAAAEAAQAGAPAAIANGKPAKAKAKAKAPAKAKAKADGKAAPKADGKAAPKADGKAAPKADGKLGPVKGAKAKAPAPKAAKSAATPAATPKAPEPKPAAPVASVAPAPSSRHTPRAYRDAANLFKQVADTTRLRVLMILADGERNVGDVCSLLRNMTQPAVSHHLALLRHGRLIEPRRAGKHNFYTLSDAGRALVGVVTKIMTGEG